MQENEPSISPAGFAALFVGRDAGALIANLRTTVFCLTESGTDLPATRNEASDAPTCYLCCPSAAYVDYAHEELRAFESRPALKWTMAWMLRLTAPLLRATGFDHQVQPNNWLVSTNIWCGIDRATIARVTQAIRRDWPGRAIVWRSLNDVSDAPALAAFAAEGYRLYPARQVYLFDCRDTQPRPHRDERNDLKLMRQASHRVAERDEIGETDFERIAELYSKLYLEKYTRLNPQYSAAFMRTVHDARMVHFMGLRNAAGTLDGIIGFFERGDVMTAPIVGYDTAIDAGIGLYRQLTAIGLQRARQRRVLYNLSAGAASFKRSRGATPAIEYTAIFNRHLGRRKRMAGWFVRQALVLVGVPTMRRLRL